jgi:hypothetical protein
MIRVEGIPVVARRLQKALRSACQAVPFRGTPTADRSARDEFQTGLDMDPGTIIQGSSGTPHCLQGRIA